MGNTKFKVGDKVRVVKARIPNQERYIGSEFVISRVNPNHPMNRDEHYEINKDCPYIFYVDELELVESAQFTKADLKPGMVVEYRNGDKALYINEYFMEQHTFMNVGRFYNDLTFMSPRSTDRCYDICKVYTSKATRLCSMFDDNNLQLIWERKEEEHVKEMTVAEIEEKLGYKVKIVDGE